ncbi:MAG: hypothetical protein STSR0007_13610 [Thermovirga sp.]
MQNAIDREVALAISSLESAASSLDALSPLRVLSRGFASCSSPLGKVVGSVSAVKPGDDLNVRFKDGCILAVVKQVRSH